MERTPRARIEGFLSTHFEGRALGEDEDIFSSGYVTSMFAVQLVTFLESEFGIRVDNEDLNLDNFRTLKAMQALVERKLAATQGGA